GRLATRVALPPILRSRRTTRPRRDLPLSVLDGDPHRPGGAGDDLLRRLTVIGVEVGHLPLRDLTQLSLGDRAHLRRVRRPRALLDAGRLDEQPSRGRGLENERERPVLVDADLGWDDVAPL